jgi:hypothetical protein
MNNVKNLIPNFSSKIGCHPGISTLLMEPNSPNTIYSIDKSDIAEGSFEVGSQNNIKTSMKVVRKLIGNHDI